MDMKNTVEAAGAAERIAELLPVDGASENVLADGAVSVDVPSEVADVAESVRAANDDCVLLNELAIDDAARAIGFDASVVERIKDYCREILRGEVSVEALKIIAAGLAHDSDVKLAEGEGYLRGRNEKIELENRFDGSAEQCAWRGSVMPRFAHRSIWEIE